MKFVVLFVLNVFVSNCIAQHFNTSGVYLTYEDFEIGNLSHNFKVEQEDYSLWPKGFLKYKDLRLDKKDTIYVFKRSDIWGYIDHKKRLIRIFNNRHFRVLCDKGLIIYIIYSPTRTTYYFSKTLNDSIYRLTKRNLNVVFAEHQVLKKINTINSKKWLIWDEVNQQFLINQFFCE
jgi:hypothetical protein